MKTKFAFLIYLLLCVFARQVKAQDFIGKRWIAVGFDLNGSNSPNNSSSSQNTSNQSSFNINFELGKFISNDMLVGINPGFSYSDNRYNNNYQFNASYDISQSSNPRYNYGMGLFIRKQFQIFNNKLYWWLQPNLNYSYNTGSQFNLTDSYSENSTDSNTRYHYSYLKSIVSKNQVALNLSAGFTYFINKRFAVSISTNVFSNSFSFGKTTNYTKNYVSNQVELKDIIERTVHTNNFSSSTAFSASLNTSIKLSYLF